MYDLKGRKILIIGASSGIGEKTARVLAEIGAYVILVARREKELNRICTEIGDENSCYFVWDISKTDSIVGLFDNVVNKVGKLDGMVYVAGITADTPLKHITHDKLCTVFDVNFFGFIECVRQISNRKNYNNGLRIVALSSTASVRGEKAHTMYSASKGALDASVRCLARELYRKGIAINTVQPSMINTDMYKSWLEHFDDEDDAYHKLCARQYGGLGETDDVANAIAFLLSPKSRFITGIALPVDGGFTTT